MATTEQPEYFHWRAQEMVGQRRWTEATIYLEVALDVLGRHNRTLLKLGDIYTLMGRTELAVDRYLEVPTLTMRQASFRKPQHLLAGC